MAGEAIGPGMAPGMQTGESETAGEATGAGTVPGATAGEEMFGVTGLVTVLLIGEMTGG